MRAAGSEAMKITIVLNATAGTLRGLDAEAEAERLAAIFRRHGHHVAVEVHRGKDAVAAIARICAAKGCDAIVVGGGDGSVSAAAAAAAKSGVTLGVLPLGTMNLFARSLRVPLDLETAAEALAAGRPVDVDIGEVNGRLFVHHVTLGLHPRMISIRERLKYGSRLGKILANVQALWLVLRRPPYFQAEIEIDGRRIKRRTAALVVSNNPFGEGHLPYADDLRQGRFGIYVGTSRRWTDLLQLAATVTLGAIRQNRLLEHWTGRAIMVVLPRPTMRGSVDGEIVRLASPLRIVMHPRALSVLRPADAGEAAAGAGNQPIAGALPEKAQEGRAMAHEELTKTEARQGENRNTNIVALVVGIVLAFAILAVIYLGWLA
ncbi:diacylglycerol/lipid kinase family protein [Propylenella binzhouense]|uniref:Diacylglycerol kinase family lipid kinase n=1 Tax=Propylenella binzhouense TaxID=2555902 RepID=A0A964T4V6_9HYPH|nr:diacylglycerol kinase family protein [Propylenella binzhouense]MYZ48435.1 diacylglycerol kinase family lipid kinase [Propylenella binzhouense]